MSHIATIQEQIQTYLKASPVVADAATGGIWTRPLKRAGEDVPPGTEYTGDNDPTPQAFDANTGWVKPSIVIGQRLDYGRYYGTTRATSKYMIMVPIIAYYAPPTDQQGHNLSMMSLLTGRVLHKKRIQFAPGEFGRLLVPHEIMGSVEIPEMPNSGVVMIERLEIVAVFDRT